MKMSLWVVEELGFGPREAGIVIGPEWPGNPSVDGPEFSSLTMILLTSQSTFPDINKSNYPLLTYY